MALPIEAENLIGQLTSIERNVYPYSEKSLEIKNSIDRTSVTGFLSNFSYEELLNATSEISDFMYSHEDLFSRLIGAVERIKPKTAALDEDPFF